MHRSYETIQFESSLEKAERGLREAIDITRRKEKFDHAEAESGEENPLGGDIGKKVKGNKDKFKPLYGYAPELSRSSELETSLADAETIDEEQKKLLDELKNKKDLMVESIAGDSSRDTDEAEESEAEDAPDFIQTLEKELNLKAQKAALLSSAELADDEFHDGFESVQEVGEVHRTLNITNRRFRAMRLINESRNYSIASFNGSSDEMSDEEEISERPPQGSTSSFMLETFGDEEEEIVPYDSNISMLLGEDAEPAVEEEEPLDIEAVLAAAKALEEQGERISANAEAAVVKPINAGELEKKAANIISEKLEVAKKDADNIISEALAEAEDIRANAEAEAQTQIDIKVKEAVEAAYEEAYAKAFEKGHSEGMLAAQDAVNEGMREEAAQFRNQLITELEHFNARRDEILESNLGRLTDLAVDIAEKVVKISLKSSKEVITGMIMAAAEDCRNKEWAKVYISYDDKAIAINLEKELIDALNQISENVKVIVMEDEPAGTCIIESPDQIIDASADVQLDNIRHMVQTNK